MKQKKVARLRRARQTRVKISQLRAVRLAVHRSNAHIYAQVIDAPGSKVIASASSLDKDLRESVTNGGNIQAASAVGKRIAEKAREKGIETVAFDRAG